MSDFDPTDYTKGELPDQSDIRKCLNYGIQFEFSNQRWHAISANNQDVAIGNSQAEAARLMAQKHNLGN